MRQPDVYLIDIFESIQKIEKYIYGFDFENFKRNELVVDAVLRNLEIIGEAVKKLPENIKVQKKDIEWRKIAGLRDILIHEYFGINVKLIWDVVTQKLPPLKEAVRDMIDSDSSADV